MGAASTRPSSSRAYRDLFQKMIANSDLDTAINKARPLSESLQRFYQQLPQNECQCEQPGVCCAFLPEMTWLEAVQWAGLIREMPADGRTKILQNVSAKELELSYTATVIPHHVHFIAESLNQKLKLKLKLKRLKASQSKRFSSNRFWHMKKGARPPFSNKSLQQQIY